jgi:hypothetical protein
VSVCVHALPSLHGASSALSGFEQAPVDGLQAPASWHWSEAGHAFVLAPVQLPAWQVSVCVQALPSLQVSPFDFAGFEQTPLDGLHVPTS